MQDEVNEKTIALYIKTGKLTAQTLQKAMKAILSKGKKQLAKPPQGKQSLKQLMKQNAGVSNIEITEGNIKAFESTAKKYGIDFALKKDTTESPPRYLVFFKGRDADVLTADIRFDIADYYGGLHCGECFDVFTGGKWRPTRIEMSAAQEWYLVGIRAEDLNGLRVRI